MNNYLFLMSDRKMFDINDREHTNSFSCREYIIYYYRWLMKTWKPEDYPNINLYFGHDSTCFKKEVISRYIPICNEIWKNKFEVSIIDLYDIEDSPDVKDCKERANNPHNSSRSLYKNVPLLKIHGAVNPLDISLILYLSWFGKVRSREMERYLLTKKYTELIQDTYAPFDIKWSFFIVNGPETYIIYLQSEPDNKLWVDINNIYKEHLKEGIF